MIDWFGRKARAERDYWQAVAASRATQLREMDQLIYNMSQMDSWKRMRAPFQKLVNLMQPRQKMESDRITGIIIEELNK